MTNDIIRKKMIKEIEANPNDYGVHENLSKTSMDKLTRIFAIMEIQKINIINKKISSSKNKKAFIEIENLQKTFGKGKNKNQVHKDITLKVFEGETLAIIGANGAGKTVLMETLVGVRKQDKGKIIFDFGKGNDPFEEIGMQFQDSDANSKLKPKGMIEFIKRMYKLKVNDKQLEEMIEVFGIKDFLNRKIKKLSGGQRQRLNLLLATMHNPKLMILDEFITGLDIISVHNILDYIKKIKEENNSTMIIISHQPSEIKKLSDRILVLKDGMIKSEYLTKDINEKYDGDFDKFLIEHI